ncbi:hypothetical protein IF1G_09643 [Cordyceps javanica]|uniref:Uncharacterized protein n=1 Tax=Cordyceps javanica TaxID=43265 RepID=A0A545UQ36_9HYPO|nr:hypothetical protein IF1G_09643 [Cordyceps javanica]
MRSLPVPILPVQVSSGSRELGYEDSTTQRRLQSVLRATKGGAWHGSDQVSAAPYRCRVLATARMFRKVQVAV